MRRLIIIVATIACACATAGAQDKVRFKDIDELTIETRIDSTYVFAYRLKESRSARGAVWNVRTREAVTPETYSEVKLDTLDGVPYMRLYRQVVWGNHPLNGWETWIMKDEQWVKQADVTAH